MFIRKPKREGQLEAGNCSIEKEWEGSKLWNQEKKVGAATSLEPKTNCPRATWAGPSGCHSSSDQSLTLFLISKPFTRPAPIFNFYSMEHQSQSWLGRQECLLLLLVQVAGSLLFYWEGWGGTYPQGRTLPCIFPYNNANIIVSSS